MLERNIYNINFLILPLINKFLIDYLSKFILCKTKGEKIKNIKTNSICVNVDYFQKL
jgi:hypothetical protein